MTFSPQETPKTFAHKLAFLQSRAWLPPALLLLALSSVFLFDGGRNHFYREHSHNLLSAERLAIAENLSITHNFLMFTNQTLDADGKTVYSPYNRFPIGGHALIKLAILPFEDNLSAQIYAARALMLLFFTASAFLAYLSLCRLTSSRWIALTAALLAFSPSYILYYNDAIIPDISMSLFATLLVFHGMVIYEQERRFRQLLLKTCIALLLGWHVYALLLPFIVFGLIRDLVKTRSSASPASGGALRQLTHAARALIRSRYLTLGAAALLFGISALTFNFTNEYLALNRETPLTQIPSYISMMGRIGAGQPYYKERDTAYLSWPAFPERQLYRIGMMSLPYAFSPPLLEQRIDAPPRLFVILGIAALGASLIGLLFVCNHKILLASLALSGLCWALPMRYNVAYPWHSHEAIFYIGIALTLFTLILLYLLRLSSERFVAALSVIALLIFVASALRMAHLNTPNQTAELHQAVIADFESIRSMTDGKAIQVNAMPRFLKRVRNLMAYYLAGRIIMSGDESVSPARTPDLVVTSARANGLASLTPQNRLVFLYEWDAYHRHIDKTIAQAGKPLIRSAFDVYLSDNALIYVKDACQASDIGEWFFLALYPSDESALPVERRQSGFDNLDFRFQDQAVRRSDRCIALTQLPEYDIARIHTGQYIQLADGSFEHLWEGEVRLTEVMN